MGHKKYIIRCNKTKDNPDNQLIHYQDEKCWSCFLENLSEHIEFRNGEIILKKAKIEK